MKARTYALTISAILLCAVALAGTASDIDNCCFVDRQCITDQDWVNGYHAFENNQCVAPAGSQPSGGAPAQVDNCCFVDRQCSTDQEWTDGYWAFQNNQCPTLPGAQTPTTSQATSGAPAQVNNCCFVDRQCHTDQEWTDGYYAFQNNQCAAPGQTQTSASPQSASGFVIRTAGGVVIGNISGRSILPTIAPTIRLPLGQIRRTDNCCEHTWQCNSDHDQEEGYRAFQNRQCALPGLISIVGDPDFVDYYEQRLELLKNRLPYRYNYVLSGLDKIEQQQDAPGGYVAGGTRIYYRRWAGAEVDGWDTRESAVLVHEACHVHRHDAGYRIYECDHEGWTREEVFCREMELEVLIELDAPSHVIEWARDIVAETRTGRPGLEHTAGC